jgi:hypothetical protein
MAKKNIDMVAIEPRKANAQNLTCFIALIVTATLAVICMIVACVLPAIIITTKTICWISMALEAIALGLGFVSYWIKKNAL